MSRCNLTALGISQARYEELRAFCQQYEEWKRKRARLLTGVYNKSPEAVATEAADLKSKIMLVESCVSIAVGNNTLIYKYLLKNVTERKSGYFELNPPIRKDSFYKMRRLFFVEIDKNKK